MQMVFRCLALALVLFTIVIPTSAIADEFTERLGDLRQVQVSLDGADHSYWLIVEHGRTVLAKVCGPLEAECDHHVFAIWDETGRKVFEQAPFLDVEDVADGSVVASTLREPDRLMVSTVITKGDGFEWILAEYDVDSGDVLRLHHIAPVRCLNMKGDRTGNLWCLGDDVDRRREQLDHNLVYRYDASGELISQTLPRSFLGGDPKALSFSFRQSAPGGFLRGDGPVRLWFPKTRELFSFDHQGAVRDHEVTPAIENLERTRMVSAPDGHVYAMLSTATDPEDPDTWSQGLYRLADDASAWEPLAGIAEEIPMRFTVAGADENGLVLLDRPSLTLYWWPVDE
jgi:hypothetical protein